MSDIIIRPPTIKTQPAREVQAAPSLRTKQQPGDAPVADDSAKPDPGKVRAEFKPEEFTRAITQHGHFVIWEKAVMCPCHKQELQQPDPNCDLCDGGGFFYVQPVEIQALVLTVDKSMKLYEKQGTWLQGTCSITVEPQYRLGHRDKIRLRDPLMVFNEVLVKGNRRGRRKHLADGVDAARYRITHMVYLTYLDDSGAVHELQEKVHFRINEDGQIEWLKKGKLVPDGASYSARYEFHPVYLIESWPHAIRQEIVMKKSKQKQTVTALVMQAVGRLDYLTYESATKGTVPVSW